MRSLHLLHVPLIAQPTDYECGNTSLTAVAQYHGKQVSTREMRELARTKTVGTDHRDMIAGALATGATVFVRADGNCAELASFVGLGLPVIVGWWSMGAEDSHFDRSWSLEERRAKDRGHYSVVCGVTATGFVFMDPERDALCEMTEDAFDAVWYDTDGDAYERVSRWYLVPHYAGRRFADMIGGGRDHVARDE